MEKALQKYIISTKKIQSLPRLHLGLFSIDLSRMEHNVCESKVQGG